MAQDPIRDAARRRRERIAAGLAIAASGVLAFFFWSWLWVVFVIACSVVFPALGLRTVKEYEEGWNVPTPPSDTLDRRLEYQEASDDWRHRDRLTWQMPTVLVGFVGVVMTQLYGKSSTYEYEWIRVAILVMLASISGTGATPNIEQPLG